MWSKEKDSVFVLLYKWGFGVIMNFFPLDNPVLIFSLLLFIILGTPYIFRRLKIPGLIGLIIAGSIVGPHGLYLLNRDASIELYGTVGLLYIMFLASLEIDIADFKKNSHKSIIFGLYTFILPMILGYFSSRLLLHQSGLTSLLIASIYASHTLLTYPIITKYGITKNRAVNVAVGGTIITVVLALVILAIVIGVSKGDITPRFWLDLLLYFILFTFIVTFIFQKLARWFLKKESDNIAQYLFILGILFFAGFLAEISRLEAIIGAFLTGLALNPLIPRTSPLKNRIDFIGNALFIPIFLIGVGMLIDFKVIFTNLNTLYIGLIMIFFSTFAKYIAALITQKIFHYSKDEKNIIFGLSNSQAAATLAAVMVGYRVDLINENILNGTILMILGTCIIASFATEKGAKSISENTNKIDFPEDEISERILIPLNNPGTVEELINLGLSIKSKQFKDNIYALNILSANNTSAEDEKKSSDLLDKASATVAATDQKLHSIIRYDTNVSNAICNIVKEKKISDLIIGLHKKKGIIDSFLGKLSELILLNCQSNVFVYKTIQPMNTLKKLIIVIPERAERDTCFPDFIKKIWNLASNAGIKLVIFASEHVNHLMRSNNEIQPISLELISFTDWEDFLYISSKLENNTGLLIYMNRPGSDKKNETMNKIIKYIHKYFEKYNFILFYPEKQE